MKIRGVVTAVVLLLAICQTSRSEEPAFQSSQKNQQTQPDSSSTGSTTEATETLVGVGGGESRGNKDVGVSAEDTDSRQLNAGAFPPRILPGPPRPPGPFPSQFPPPGPFDPSFDYQSPTGVYPGEFPGPIAPRPPRPPPPGRPYPPGPYPQRPFPGQRPPRPPPPPPYDGPFPSIFNPTPFAPLPLPTTIVNRAISSISEFDDQKCVPRLLCEISAGSMPGVYSGGYRPYRPYRPPSQGELFVGQEQLLQLLAALTLGNREASPLSHFGGAALLGISSRGNPEHCYRAFPECPQDPDRLLEYLNTHRGGFFKAVGQPLNNLYGPQTPEGPVPRPPPRPLPQRPLGPYPPRPQGPLSPRPYTYYSNSDTGGSTNSTDYGYSDGDNAVAASGDTEPRIQVHPERIVGLINNNRQMGSDQWRFPFVGSGASHGGKKGILPPTQSVLGNDVYRKGLRKGKKVLQFAVDPPNPIPAPYPAIPMIFPDRTGTGDLRLDSSELLGNNKRPGVSHSDSSSGNTRYGRIYFPKEVVRQESRPGEINTRFYVIFPGPAN